MGSAWAIPADSGIWRKPWTMAVALALYGLGAVPSLGQAPVVPTGMTYDESIAHYGDGLKENLAFRKVHDDLTGDRAHRAFYPAASLDLSDLPAYEPKQKLAGTVRVSGSYLVNGGVADLWKAAFAKFQPNIKVVFSAQGDVASGAVDIETGPRVKDRLLQASDYELKLKHSVFEMNWAAGSYDVPGWSPAFSIFVSKNNPIQNLSMEQLDGIFGGARTGGWDGTTWRTDMARGPEKNIRTWGELGLSGEWADKPIHVYGRPLKYNIELGFERKVFHGGDVWNENLDEYAHELNPDGTRYTSSVEMVKDLAKDKYGICFADMGSIKPEVKPVSLSVKTGGPAVPVSVESIHHRTYPLFLEEWAETNLEPGQPLDPAVKEFLTFMLSREGQEAIAQDGKWIPMPGSAARAELKKLDQTGETPNLGEMGLQLPMIRPPMGDGDLPDETGNIKPREKYYTKHWDLSDLPAYKPEQEISGTLKLSKSGEVMASTVGEAWMKGFAKYHPNIKFELAAGKLGTGQIDIQTGRKWTTYFAGEVMQYQLKYKRSPTEIQIGTGSFDVPGWSPAFGIYVNKNNPVSKVTIAELDGIFGGPRRGGWAGTAWRRQVGRTASKNIRTWGQLGATGAWEEKKIDVYTPPLKYHIMSVVERLLLGGGNMWNDNLQEYPLRISANGDKVTPSAETVGLAGKNPYGITFSQKAFATPDVKPLAIAAKEGGPYVELTAENVRNRTYPLALEVYAYVDQPPGGPLDPKVKAFLKYVVSREGQDALQQDGKWLPLTGDAARVQMNKLDAIMIARSNSGSEVPDQKQSNPGDGNE